MGWTPLHYAAHSSKTDVTRALIERGASPSIKNNKGKLAGTPSSSLSSFSSVLATTRAGSRTWRIANAARDQSTLPRAG
jgi:ankyrin repeat protein